MGAGFSRLFVGAFSIVIYCYSISVLVGLYSWLINFPKMLPTTNILTTIYPGGVDYQASSVISEAFFKKIPVPEEWQPWVIDLTILFVWMFSHSFFARPMVKKFLGEASQGEISIVRSLYCLNSALLL